MRSLIHSLTALLIGLTVLSAARAQKSNAPVKAPGFNVNQIGSLANTPKPAPNLVVKPVNGLNPNVIRSLTNSGSAALAQADLAVTDVTITPLGNGQFQYQATIKNLGQAQYPGNRTFSLQVIYDPRLDGSERNLPTTTVKTDSGAVQPLSPGQSMTLSGTFTRTDRFGSISCSVQISQGDNNRSNDSKSTTIILGN
ncbi:MAG TPA: hypothetical protein VGZ47_23960 [Gemmataceae bacterium]|jgi:hypothetical protein|nr:hypothetical protein [Gemmataceae bacterium]